MEEAQVFIDSSKYVEALHKYTAAKLECPQKKEEVIGYIQQLFEVSIVETVAIFELYEGRFARVEDKKRCYFIDQNGDEVKKLREWQSARQFDWRNGFANLCRIVR
jgi:hypothetical protein